jgi:hypothetical protein
VEQRSGGAVIVSWGVRAEMGTALAQPAADVVFMTRTQSNVEMWDLRESWEIARTTESEHSVHKNDTMAERCLKQLLFRKLYFLIIDLQSCL